MIIVTSRADQAGLAEVVLEEFAKQAINLEYITEGAGKESCVVMSFCVNTKDKESATNIIEELYSRKIINTKQCISPVSFIGIYGPHFREKPGLTHRLCYSLSKIGINILGISSSISTVSCIIREEDFDKAKAGLLDYFEPS